MTRTRLPSFVAFTAALLLAPLAAVHGAATDNATTASSVLQTTGIRGGLVVHIGCGDGKLTAALCAKDSFIVQGLDADVNAARQHIQSLGLYGPVSAEPWTGNSCPMRTIW